MKWDEWRGNLDGRVTFWSKTLIERLQTEADRDAAEMGFAHELLLEAADAIAALSAQVVELQKELAATLEAMEFHREP